jgi:hypothetical protein
LASDVFSDWTAAAAAAAAAEAFLPVSTTATLALAFSLLACFCMSLLQQPGDSSRHVSPRVCCFQSLTSFICWETHVY